MILWGSFCGVHTVFQPRHVAYWRERDYRVLVHPECPKIVVDAADGAGSTKFLWNALLEAKPGDRLAIGTDGHFVRNAREQAALRGEAPDLNRVLPGDSVDEVTARRERLDPEERDEVVKNAREALERMISITQAAAR